MTNREELMKDLASTIVLMCERYDVLVETEIHNNSVDGTADSIYIRWLMDGHDMNVWVVVRHDNHADLYVPEFDKSFVFCKDNINLIADAAAGRCLDVVIAYEKKAEAEMK